MDKIYALETAPVLSTTEVLVKASQDTIDQIAYVKALIDVTGVKQNFETTAPIVAYNQQGQMLDVDIFPETVTASVSVTTPMKEVPIKVKPIGELPNGMAIESINLDHSTVQVYAPNSVLSTLDEIVVELDATKITKNSNWTYSLTLPSGVNSFSITKVNIDVKIAESMSRTVDGVVVRYKNNAAGYKLNLVDSRDAMLSVTVTGTEKNIKNITADDINLYIDLADITPGTNQDLPIVIGGKVGLVNYAIADGRTSLAVSVVE
jgi:YbbR domain-containing protein